VEKPKISLVIPCYNEAENLERLVTRCEEVFSEKEIEVILVDNGSIDQTSEEITKLTAHSKVFRSIRINVNKGYGYGIHVGLTEAKGDYLGWTHADLQTDPIDVLLALNILQNQTQDKDIFIKGKRINRPFFDTIFAWGMAVFETLTLGKFLWDINAQPNIFSRKFYESLNFLPNDFSIDLFVYAAAVKKDIPIKRVPVSFPPRQAGVGSNDSIKKKIQFSIKAIKFSLKVKRKLKKVKKCPRF